MMFPDTFLTIFIAGGTAFITAFVQWFFYKRSHKAAAVQAEATAMKTQIENYQLIVGDWKNTALEWQQAAEKYREQLINERKKVDEMETTISEIQRELKRASCKIMKLEEALKAYEKA